MILLRPADPAQPIRIENAVAIPLEEPPPAWLAETATYVIESADVELPDA